MGPEFLLVAKNIICQGDDTVKICPGYTLVQQLDGPVVKLSDWQRPTDKQQFIMVQHGQKLGAIIADGSQPEILLSNSEDVTAPFDFVTNYFAAYGGNGKQAYKFVDNLGQLTRYQWGITAPTVAPTIALGAGTLTLKYGRQHLYCFVSYITDNAGIRRMHISAPSPSSAHTGPQTSQVVTVGAMQVSADPQVTHKWVFSTVDTPFNTSSVYYFEGEVTNATTSFGDTLIDPALDTTRIAPFDNHPAPLGSIIVSYQNCAVIINPDTGFIQISGFEEIDLGIPMEAFPSPKFFSIPSGVRKPTGASVVDDGNTLLIGTEEAWYKITGYNADTFQEKDRVVGPGPVGKKCITRTPTHLIWLSRDKRLWAWDTRIQAYIGIPAMPLEISFNITQKLPGTYSMEDLKDSQLSNAELSWFTYGKHHYIVLAANTNDAVDNQGFSTNALNWVQLWYVNYENGTVKSLGETDFIPSDLMASCANVLVGSTPYLFFGDASTGAIYRWPDGYLHNGVKTSPPMYGSAWTQCQHEGESRFYWADIITDRVYAATAFQVYAVMAPEPDMLYATIRACPVQQLPAAYAPAPLTIRASFQQPGTSMGKWMRILIAMPADGAAATIKKILISSKPIYATAP